MEATFGNVTSSKWSLLQRMLSTTLLLLFLGATATSAQAQIVATETTWGGASFDVSEDVAVATDGSSYLVGRTASFSEFGTQIVFLVKFAADGSLIWQRSWDGPSQFFDDAGRDIAIAPDGSVYVAGSTLGAGGDALLLKFGPDGTPLSQQRWGSNDGEFGYGVAVSGDGSTYLVGSSRIADPNAADVFVVKFAPNGTLVWQKTWGILDSSEQAEGVAVGPDGSVYVATETARADVAFGIAMALLKIAPDGNLVWARTYAVNEIADSRGGVTVSPDGSIYVAGGTFDLRTSDLIALVVKFAPDGSLVWDRAWGGRSTGEDVADISVAPNGAVLLAGQTAMGAGGEDAFLVRFDPNGRVLDAVTWGNAGSERAAGVAAAPSGTISLGAIVSTPPPYSLLAASTMTLRAKGKAAASAIPLVAANGTVTDPGGVFGTPNGSTTYGGGFETALVRIVPPPPRSGGGVLAELAAEEAQTIDALGEAGSGRLSAADRMMSIAPNPTLASTRVAFSVPFEANGRPFSVAVLDVTGRRVRAIEAGLARAGAVEVKWDLRDDAGARVPDGLYFIRVAVGSHEQALRVVVTH